MHFRDFFKLTPQKKILELFICVDVRKNQQRKTQQKNVTNVAKCVDVAKCVVYKMMSSIYLQK